MLSSSSEHHCGSTPFCCCCCCFRLKSLNELQELPLNLLHSCQNQQKQNFVLTVMYWRRLHSAGRQGKVSAWIPSLVYYFFVKINFLVSYTCTAKPHQQQLLSHMSDDDLTSSKTNHLSPDARAAEVRINNTLCVSVYVQCTRRLNDVCAL